jgi:hypothetical protein
MTDSPLTLMVPDSYTFANLHREQRSIKPVLRNKVVGARSDRRLAFFTGLKKVSKEMTALAAGMTVRLDGF